MRDVGLRSAPEVQHPAPQEQQGEYLSGGNAPARSLVGESRAAARWRFSSWNVSATPRRAFVAESVKAEDNGHLELTLDEGRVRRRNEQALVRLTAYCCCALAIACGKTEDSADGRTPGGASAGESASVAGGGAGPASAGSASGVAGGSGADGANGGATAGHAGDSGPCAPSAAYWQFGRNADSPPPRQPEDTAAKKIGVDASEGIYVGGTTQTALQNPRKGTVDLYVRKYDQNGSVLWTLQWGESGNNKFFGLAVEANGNFYVAGENADSEVTSYYINKYDSNGQLLRAQQRHSLPHVIALDTGANLYVVDRTSGGSNELHKYDSGGLAEWTTPFGAPSIEWGVDAAIDATGNVYVASNTQGTVQNHDEGKIHGWLYKFEPSGSLVWSEQFPGASRFDVSGVAVDPNGNVYVTGSTDGALSGGAGLDHDDAFIRKYDPSGRALWTRQFGASVLRSVRVDVLGNPHVSGTTEDADPFSYGGFVRKYDANGTVQWTTRCSQVTTSDLPSLAIANSGNVYAAGITHSNALVVKVDAH